MVYENYLKLEFDSNKENVKLARDTIALFCSKLNPTEDEIYAIKLAVSEAVTNAIIHGYENKQGRIIVETNISNKTIDIKVFDTGTGIENIEKSLEPFYTTKCENENTGIGFTLIDTYMDSLDIKPNTPTGTIVYMTKTIK